MIIKKIMAIAMFLLIPVALMSCNATVERMAETPSGRPEVVISAPRAEIANLIINESINEGYTIVSQTDFSIQMSRPLNSNENIAASLFVGNSYSNNSRWLTFTLTEVPEGIRVIISAEIQAAMVGGQINRQPLNANTNFNTYQSWLLDIKAQLE